MRLLPYDRCGSHPPTALAYGVWAREYRRSGGLRSDEACRERDIVANLAFHRPVTRGLDPDKPGEPALASWMSLSSETIGAWSAVLRTATRAGSQARVGAAGLRTRAPRGGTICVASTCPSSTSRRPRRGTTSGRTPPAGKRPRRPLRATSGAAAGPAPKPTRTLPSLRRSRRSHIGRGGRTRSRSRQRRRAPTRSPRRVTAARRSRTVQPSVRPCRAGASHRRAACPRSGDRLQPGPGRTRLTRGAARRRPAGARRPRTRPRQVAGGPLSRPTQVDPAAPRSTTAAAGTARQAPAGTAPRRRPVGTARPTGPTSSRRCGPGESVRCRTWTSRSRARRSAGGAARTSLRPVRCRTPRQSRTTATSGPVVDVVGRPARRRA